jgi:chemotaxis protein MotB
MSKRKKHHEEHENHERWLITYADLITLLLGLFVVLYSMSQLDLQKYQQFAAAFSRIFGGGAGILPGDKGVLAAPIVPKSGGDGGGTDKEDLLSDKPGDKLEIQLNAILSSSIKAKEVILTTTPEGLTIHLLERLLFESGSAELRAESKAVLDTLAEILRLLPNKIRIEGHTDNRPIRSARFPSNWHLSVARALNTAYYLMGRGVRPEKISIAGYAEFRPIAPNDTEENRAKNRRVDIVILSMKNGILGEKK